MVSHMFRSLEQGEAVDPIQDEFHLTTLEQLELLSGDTRIRILQASTKPATVAEIAEHLGVPKTRLYYHVNQLAEAGLLVHVDTRKSGARLEKVYRAAARKFGPSEELLDDIDDPVQAAKATIRAVIDPSIPALEAALARQFDGEELAMDIGRSMGRLTPAQVRDVQAKLAEVVDIFRQRDTDFDTEGDTYVFTFAFNPASEGVPE